MMILNIKIYDSHGTRKFTAVHSDSHQLRRDLCFGGSWKSNSLSVLWTMGTLEGEGPTPGREG